MTVSEIRRAQQRGLKFLNIGGKVLNVQQQNALICVAEQRGLQGSPKAIAALVKNIYY